jgi:hypothetical protein
VLGDLGALLGVLHRLAGSPLEVADQGGAKIGIVREPASSAARLIREANRKRCSGEIRRPRWWASMLS